MLDGGGGGGRWGVGEGRGEEEERMGVREGGWVWSEWKERRPGGVRDAAREGVNEEEGFGVKDRRWGKP